MGRKALPVRRGWRTALPADQLPRLTQPARGFAVKALDRLRARASARGKGLADLPDDQLHSATGMGSLIGSVIFGALKNPLPDIVDEFIREWLMTLWHSNLPLPFDQYHQIAEVRFTRNDHRAKFGALHQSIIARQIEPTRLITFAPWLMT